jgi:hypothetical protein
VTYNLGDVVPLSVTITDANGQPANAGAVAVSVTLPDGTTTASGSITPASTGIYNYDYPTVQAGRHSVRWLATGVNASAYTDMVDVAPADPGQIISLADTKTQLNITGTDHDGELADMIRSVTVVCERYVGAIVRRPYTETFSGGVPRLALTHVPVLSLTTVTESGVTLTPADYRLVGASGVLSRVVGQQIQVWVDGIANVTVTYVAGRTAVEPHVRQAALIMVQHMWETQRGTSGFQARDPDTYDPRYSYSIPRRALELLGEPIPGIA